MATQSLNITFTASSAATLTDMASYAGKAYGYQSTINGLPNPLTVVQFLTQALHDEVINSATNQKAVEAAAAASAAINYNNVS